MKFIGIGDNVVDVYLDQKQYYPGGNCVNVAVNLKRLGSEEVAYLGIFGTDEQAEHIRWALDVEGVPYHRSRSVIGSSGQPQVNLTEDGDRVFVGGPKDTVQHIVKLKLTPEDLNYISNFDLAHVSCYSSMEEELPKLAEIIKVSYDFSDQHDDAYLEKVCPHIQFGFFSAAEYDDPNLEKLIERVSKYNLEVIGITRGGKPALFIHGGKRYDQEPMPVDIVDTMGAGDSFIAGFLKGYHDGLSMGESLLKAAESAAITCSFFGGFGHPKKMSS